MRLLHRGPGAGGPATDPRGVKNFRGSACGCVPLSRASARQAVKGARD